MILKNRELVIAQLRLKIEEWFSTILDPRLVDDMRRTYVLAGGAIVSLLQGEKPKDYDIWFTDWSVTVRVLNYYFNTDFSGFNCVYHAFAPDRSSALVECIYADNPEHNKVRKYYWIDRSDNTHSPILSLSSRSLTLRNDFQVVYFDYRNSPEKIVAGFDFTHNRCFITNDRVSFPEDALDAIADKELKFIGSTHPVSALARVAKYIKRGYGVSSRTLLDITKNILELPAEEREKQTEYVVIDSSGDVV